MVLTSSAAANPVGGQVEAGSATITTPSANTVQINQVSDKAILSWQSFNIGASEKTQFIQPNASSVALNRINPSQGASQILGTLTSNGQIILVNQAGIYFGPGSRVDVAGIIASTSDITNQNFLAGNYIFDLPSQYYGSIINEGSIIASQNGLVAFLGASVSNRGLIQATLGSVILASGSQFTITFSGNQLISFVVDGDARSAGVDQNGVALKNGVSNSGQIMANGGRILITAKTASTTLDNAINMVGVAQAQSVSEHNGEIILSASAGVVHVAGKLDVSGISTNEKGGKVTIIGKNIVIDAPTVIDASGFAGGGEILIGGNLQGLGVEPNALNTTINLGVLIKANALQYGHGGKIIVWSDKVTTYAGHISATGGALSGDGGFAEVSGHKSLKFHGTIDLTAAHGLTGRLLLDPENLTIQIAGPSTVDNSGNIYTSNVDNSILTVADLQTALLNANVLVQTGSGGLQAGDITVADSITWSNPNTLTLSAFQNIIMNASISNSSGGSLTLKADNTGTGIGTIAFSGITSQINMSGGGAVNLYYNPSIFPTPTNFSSNVTTSGGTIFTPYMLVNTLTNLQNMNNNLTGNYALGTNIDASATSEWNAGAGFVPISTSAANFTGQFDGQSHIIDRLTIFLPLADSVGLFGYVNSSGMIQNIGLTNMTITGLTNVGGLIGFDAAGIVNNAYSTGTVTSGADSSNVGGLVGFSGSNVINSYSTATVLAGATSNYIGGLVGRAGASINTSYHATGSVTAGATSAFVGGLTGYSVGSISHAYNTGPVFIGATGSSNVGGLIGYSVGNVYYSYNTGAVTAGAAVTNVGGLVGYGFGTINNSYSTGLIVTGATGSSNIGGLVGFAGNNVNNSYSNSSISGGAANNNVGGLVGQNNAIISNSYSTGSVAAGAGSAFLGGLVGLNNATVNNSFWDIQTSAQLASAGGAGKTTAEMMQQTTFCPSGNCSGDLTHFDFATNWGIVNGVIYPYLIPATLTYAANTGNMTYGGVIPFFSGIITGFVGSETLSTATTGSLSFTTLATANSNVGNYSINGSGLTANNGNYVFTQSASNATALTINPATLTYDANTETMTYGSTVPPLSGAVTGFVNSQTQASATTGTLLFTSPATFNSNVGTYSISGSGLTANNGNYIFSQAAGNATDFSITQAALTLTATNQSKTYGDTLTLGTSAFIPVGLQNSETVGSVTLTSSGASSLANVSSSPYAIAPSAATGGTFTASNYSISYVDGILTVNPATLIYNANTGTMTYGSTVPPLSGTVAGFVNSQTQASATTGILAFTSLATSSSNVGNYEINGSGLTANNGNYIFSQAASNATALTITPATPVVPVVDPVIVSTIASNPNLELIPNILSPETTINNGTNNGSPDITIINNTDFSLGGQSLTFIDTSLSNASGILSNNSLGSYAGTVMSTLLNDNIKLSNTVIYSLLENNTVSQSNIITFISKDSKNINTSLFLAGLLILIITLLAMRLLTIIARKNNVLAENATTSLHDYYNEATVAHVINGDAIPIEHLITTNYIFKGNNWVIESPYSEFVLLKIIPAKIGLIPV